MNREELVRLAARRKGLPEVEVDVILGSILDSIVLSLAAGHAVTLRGFGTFEVRDRKATKRNVPGKGVISLPAGSSVGFKASPLIKERLKDHERTSH